jgi:hypothetical protein
MVTMAADGYEADRGTQKGASTVTNEEITRAFMDNGWEIRYRGGNSMCTTPNDLDVIVADMPGSLGGKSSTPWLGPPTRYSIAARVSGAGLYSGQGPIFDLYDAERGVTVGMRWVPTPERAAELLERYGVPESAVWDTPAQVIAPEAVE